MNIIARSDSKGAPRDSKGDQLPVDGTDPFLTPFRVSNEQLKAEQALLDSLKPGEDLVALQHAFDAADEEKKQENP
jgi:hypothetical protein